MAEQDNHLGELRRGITDLTDQLLNTFSERGALALAIAAAKQDDGATQIRDLDREQAVIDRAVEQNEGPFSDEVVAQLVQFVMDAASNLQAEATGLPLVAEPIAPMPEQRVA
jgi:chorismate mutase